YPLADWGNLYGPIGPDPLATLVAGLEHVRRTRRDWHFIELGWIEAAADRGRTKQALDAVGFRAPCEGQEPLSISDLPAHGPWRAYCASHTSKWRNNLGRQEKKLARRGAITFVRHRTTAAEADPRWDLYDTCVEISRTSWQGSAGSGTMLNKEADR